MNDNAMTTTMILTKEVMAMIMIIYAGDDDDGGDGCGDVMSSVAQRLNAALAIK